MIRVSKVSKLDNINSWSLQARETCPGSLKADGTLVDACSGCYAAFGQYLYNNVKAPRAENKEDWKREEWVADMVAFLKKKSYFRWFDSGDCYSTRLAEKIYAVMKETPWCKHWFPTRMYKFEKFSTVFDAMKALPNVAVRFSSDSVIGEYEKGLHGSTILPSKEYADENVAVCEAYERGGKCGGCRNCWDKEIPVIGYVIHGRVAKAKLRKKFAIAVA